MKKRILSLVLCAAMLLSMCLFLGAGVVDDTTDTADTADTSGTNIVSVLNAGPLVEQTQSAVTPRLMTASLNAISLAAANDADTGSDTENDGVVLNKSVSGPNADGNYTVRLEAYATGEQTTTVSTQPCDIVLVLDVSGSMDWCIEGGEHCSGEHYAATYSVDSSKYSYKDKQYVFTYYIKDASGNYQPLTWCDGTHVNQKCNGGEGWYVGRKQSQHTAGNKLTPKTSAGSEGTQFYEKVSCTSRLTALKSAVNTFIEQVAAKETDTVQHRISIVKFAGDTSDTVGNNTYYDKRYKYNYSQIVMNLTDAETNKTTLKSAVNALSAGGATRADYGMKHAQTVLNTARTGASKVVVMFTDGEPTSGSDFEPEVANSAISASKTLKDNGATVYTVGCMSGANASRVTSWSGVSNVNKYMHLVSSNYRYATSMSNSGTATYPEDEDQSYYLTASTAEELDKVFKSISSQTGGAATTLTSSAVLKDEVTPYFEIPAGATVTLKTAPCTGVNSDGTLKFDEETTAPTNVQATVTDSTVSVTGFDYKANWCGSHSGTYSGEKLIVEFQIKPTADFLGGNGVKTNVGTDDGIYPSSADDAEKVKEFTPQIADVKVKAITPTVTDAEIYLGESTNLQDRITTAIAQLNGTNNAYVDVTYTVTDESGNTVGTYTVNAGEQNGTWNWKNASTVSPEKTTTYTVTCTVTPTQVGKYNAVEQTGDFTITVKTCSLKITKTVTGGGADADQTFVFYVKDSSNNVVTTVVLKGGTSKTITGLAVDTYTVVEDTSWSWSYTIHEGDQNKEVTLSKDNPVGEAQITNTAKENHWLTSIVDVINKWTTKDGKTTIDNSGHVPAKTN